MREIIQRINIYMLRLLRGMRIQRTKKKILHKDNWPQVTHLDLKGLLLQDKKALLFKDRKHFHGRNGN